MFEYANAFQRTEPMLESGGQHIADVCPLIPHIQATKRQDAKQGAIFTVFRFGQSVFSGLRGEQLDQRIQVFLMLAQVQGQIRMLDPVVCVYKPNPQYFYIVRIDIRGLQQNK